jgi:hypothetical protein
MNRTEHHMLGQLILDDTIHQAYTDKQATTMGDVAFMQRLQFFMGGDEMKTRKTEQLADLLTTNATDESNAIALMSRDHPLIPEQAHRVVAMHLRRSATRGGALQLDADHMHRVAYTSDTFASNPHRHMAFARYRYLLEVLARKNPSTPLETDSSRTQKQAKIVAQASQCRSQREVVTLLNKELPHCPPDAVNQVAAALVNLRRGTLNAAKFRKSRKKLIRKFDDTATYASSSSRGCFVRLLDHISVVVGM